MGEVQVTARVDVDRTICKGEFIVLLGPSGRGKSTLLNILGGLDSPTSGSAFFADQDLTAATEAQRTAHPGAAIAGDCRRRACWARAAPAPWKPWCRKASPWRQLQPSDRVHALINGTRRALANPG